MELISKTEDENDLLYLYSAVIRVVFNDRIEEEEIEQLDVAEVISTFKAVAEIVDASVNEKIRNIDECDIIDGYGCSIFLRQLIGFDRYRGF